MKTRYNDFMEFRNWITAKYVEWRGDAIGNERSITDFARMLEIDKASISLWMKGSRHPGARSISKLARKYPEIYSVLEMPVPEPDQLEDIPGGLGRQLKRAYSEAKDALRAWNMTGRKDPDAERIAIEIFERHGFKYIKTVEDESEI